MNSYLKTYDITLETLAPLFIGSGADIKKKEYVYLKQENKVFIPNLPKMYQGLRKLGKGREYENYLLNDGRALAAWFSEQQIGYKQYAQWMDYELASGDVDFEGNDKKGNRTKEIQLCIKDAYGCPYVPGSSLKGALRTVLIGDHLMEKEYPDMRNKVRNFKETSRNRLLGWENKELETEVLHTLNRKKRKDDAVNDVLSGLRISDSKPLQVTDLTLCQKIDVSIKGNENKINTLRECIKPGTKIQFSITIDSQIFPYSVEDILKSVRSFYHQYEIFKNKFPIAIEFDSAEDVIYLGGGCGYATKTVTYPLLGQEDGVKTVSRIIDQTLSPVSRRQHKHVQDVGLKVSPHTLKCTRFEGKIYEFGLCRLKIH